MPTSTPIRLAGDGVTLAGDRYDAAPEDGVAMLLHGGGQTRHSWRSTAADLATRNWTTVTLDLRGHGDSGWAPDGNYSLEAFVEDLVVAVDQLRVEPVLVGASLGGITALMAVGEHRVPASGLVLVDIAPRVQAAGVERIQRFMSARPEGYADLEEVADAVAAYNPHRPRPRNLDGLRKNVRQGPDGRWHWHWDPAFLNFGDEPTRAIDHHRLMTAARNVQVPTLMVRGAQSDVVSAAGSAELAAAIPQSVEVVTPGAGHMIAGDDNAVFTRELAGFLGRVASNGTTP
ncbi:alpha/beta hydrolase [Nocardioides sp. KR10-350]|uniref:alpha/beta fold hydrolase n=1 Tax=Nocardioides cheoyonin TaxID=3156615 RepID=UPI0032B491DD